MFSIGIGTRARTRCDGIARRHLLRLGAGRRAERDHDPAEQAAGGEMHEGWKAGAHGDPPRESGGIVPVVQDFPTRQNR